MDHRLTNADFSKTAPRTELCGDGVRHPRQCLRKRPQMAEPRLPGTVGSVRAALCAESTMQAGLCHGWSPGPASERWRRVNSADSNRGPHYLPKDASSIP